MFALYYIPIYDKSDDFHDRVNDTFTTSIHTSREGYFQQSLIQSKWRKNVENVN